MQPELLLLLIVVIAYALGYGTREFISWRAQRRFRRSISYYHQDQPGDFFLGAGRPPPIVVRDSVSPVSSSLTSPEGTPIKPVKGKITKRGERVYHLPESRYYEISRIDPEKGERYFSSVSEAEAAGWRAARH